MAHFTLQWTWREVGVCRALLLTALVLAGTIARADDPPTPGPAKIVLDKGLAIPPVGRYGRNPLPIDPIAAQIAAGDWKAPKAGDEMKGADGTLRRWAAIEAGKDATFTGKALNGGYVYFNVPSARERVMVLHAAGHAMVYVNGEPRAGDVYQTGYVRVPVLLKAGDNDLLFQAARGSLRASLDEPTEKALLNVGDVLLPDLVAGEDIDVEGAVPVLNPSASPLRNVLIRIESTGPLEAGEAGLVGTRTVPVIAPLSTRKVPFRLVGRLPAAIAKKGDGKLEAQITLLTREDKKETVLDRAKVELRVLAADRTHKVTFRSDIDGSVQYYALVPAKRQPTDPPVGLVLTLHGAGVEGIGQANCFAAKPWAHVVAPTNRRPYGFDWEDWGRLDALEVLEHAHKALATDPRRTYVTGHSMGGHGTWHLGATFPGRFTAIGPSAGWICMWSYAGALKTGNPPPLHEIVLRAANPSDTLALSRNLAAEAIYVLHGDQDDNVPVGQARTMRKHLADFHGDFVYYERPGAGHWWGNECVDWKPMFELFGQRTLPAPADVRSVHFITASPGVSASMHWAAILGQQHAGKFSEITLKLDPAAARLSGTTSNVSRLAIDVGHVKKTIAMAVELDGQTVEGVKPPSMGTRIWLRRDGEKWLPASAPSAAAKNPARYGPFRDAFRNRMLFVYGTKGTPAENAWALAKARFDAETFWYRAGGAIDVIPDADFDPLPEPDRNVILYGNARTNGAWDALLADSPVQVTAGKVTIEGRALEGDDLACLFLRPRPRSDVATVGVITGTGLHGVRVADRLPLFLSGVGYPDCIVLGPEALADGLGGVRAAGYFGEDWSVKTGEFVWR